MPDKPTYNHIPALRFPDFANDGEWETKRLGEIAISFSGGTPSASNKDYYGGTISFIRSGEINSNHTELFLTQEGLDNSSAKMVEKGTILYALYGATSGEVGIARLRGAINQAILAIIPNEEYDSLFIYHYLKSQKESIINRYLQGGQGNLSGAIINALPIPIPSLAEQQRIAACLSAADEMIASTNRKLEQLKAYKKGLIQKLFPAKGKKLPELRFKEFEKDGEWEEKKLGELLMEVKETTTDTNKIPLYSLTIDDGVTSKTERYERGFLVTKKDNVFKVVSPNDFVSNPMNLRFGAVGYNQNAFSVCVSGYYDVFRFKEDGTSVFWNNYLKSDLLLHKYDEIAIGSLIEKRRVYFSNLQNLKVFVPSVCEQRKIASCLSIMDDQINAYTEKVALLRRYKKGLMQRMFPQNQIIKR